MAIGPARDGSQRSTAFAAAPLGAAVRPLRARLGAGVLDAGERQSLVAVRALGRAGIRVGAFDDRAGAPAFRSRWCRVAARVPGADDPDRYVDALVSAIGRHGPAALLLARDSTIEAVRRRRAEVDSAARLALAPEPALAIAVDKERTLALARQLGVSVPASAPIERPADVARAGAATGFPAVLKPVQSWIPASARRLGSAIAVDVAEGERVAAGMLAAGARVLLQQWVTGSREAVSLFCSDGRVRARFAQVADRMLPPLGGSSIVRESIAVPGDVGEAADALVLAAGLDGYTEVEFRRDARGVPFLMEMNPRLSASVEIAVRAGVDFPGLLHAWATDRPLPPVRPYREGLRMRWLGGDLQWLRDVLHQRGRPEAPPPREAITAFARDFVVPHAYDYLAWDDPLPALWATAGFVAEVGRRGTSKMKRKLA